MNQSDALINKARNTPEIWVESSLRILRAIDVIGKGLGTANELEKSDATLAALMLAGFAFENAFKAHFLKKGGRLYVDGKQIDLKHHELTSWATRHNIQLTRWESEALEKAEYFCVSWGRFPFHNNASKEKAFEAWGWPDVEHLKNVVSRLLGEAKSLPPAQSPSPPPSAKK